MRALLSVSDKTGILDFAKKLVSNGVSLVSTGGTYQILTTHSKLPVKKISELTGYPEILEGRVKTLHPKVHGGLLARRDKLDHMNQLIEEGIETIDLVVCNLYPFAETIASPTVTMEEALENIDIGGPTLLRAGAKNFPFVIVVTDPDDYGWVGRELTENNVTDEMRQMLAQKAFRHVSQYDSTVAAYLSNSKDRKLDSILNVNYRKVFDLRYGENPHQNAAAYSFDSDSKGVLQADLLHGKELSFNNLLDADAAWRIVSEFEDQTVAVIKHSNPCGLASHKDQLVAYSRAFEGDSVSAYGGILGFNRPVVIETVKAMKGVFYEVIVAPDYMPDALDLLKKRRNIRIIRMPLLNSQEEAYDIRSVSGGVLIQNPDLNMDNSNEWRTVTEVQPTERQFKDLEFAWKAVKHIKSNAIVLVKDLRLIGMGAGQPNRVTSVDLAARVAKNDCEGSVLASDALLPFSDNVDLAAKIGVAAIIQPGGSIRDQECIDAANEHKVSMVMTGKRHFRH